MMTEEEKMKIIEAIGKSGIFVAGDVVMEKNVQYEVGNVEAGGIGIQIVNREAAQEEQQRGDDEPLKNFCFNKSLFDTNAKLLKLRNTIAAAIDMGDDTCFYGEPQAMRINPSCKNEWYYVMKAIVESGVAKSGLSDVEFIEQMMEWFPRLFPHDSSEQLDDYKRNLAKSISHERGLWKLGKTNEEVTLQETWSKGMNKSMAPAKLERMFTIAYRGLLRHLAELKQANDWI